MNIYVNGSIMDEQTAVISVSDHGFLYGAGLFETLRSYQGHPFLFSDHYRRLQEGARFLGMKMPVTEAQLKQAVQQTMKANDLQDAYIRITLSAGQEGVGLKTDTYHSPSLVIHCKPVPTFSPSLYETGKKLIPLQTVYKYPEGIGRFKSLNYLPHIIAKREIGEQPDCEGVFLTPEGAVAEGIVSNLFFVKNHTLYTPALETGILPGITRQMVIQLTQVAGYEIKEGHYPLSQWKTADEVFLTNSIQEIVPVHTIEQTKIGKGHIGEMTQTLLQAYRSYIERRASSETT